MTLEKPSEEENKELVEAIRAAERGAEMPYAEEEFPIESSEERAEKAAEAKEQILAMTQHIQEEDAMPAAEGTSFAPVHKESSEKNKWPKWMKRAAVFAGITAGVATSQHASAKTGGGGTEKTESKTEHVHIKSAEAFHANVGDQIKHQWDEYAKFYHARVHELGLEGSHELKTRKFDDKILNEYIAKHPHTLLNRETVGKIQGEFINYKVWLLDKIKNKIPINGRPVGFADGVTEQNFMQDLSKVDKIAGPESTREFPTEYWTYIAETHLKLKTPDGKTVDYPLLKKEEVKHKGHVNLEEYTTVNESK